MLAEFVLIVSITSMPGELKYVGHFVNCEQAAKHMKMNMPEVKESRCLLEKYMYLPNNFKKRIFTISDESKGFLSDDMYGI